MDNEFRIYSNDKLVIITTKKVASRFIEKSLKLKITYFENTIIINDDLKIEPFKNSIVNSEIRNDINLINSKKSKKDLLFLYRNPYNKLISGIAQDFNIIFTDRNFLLDVLLDYYYNEHTINDISKEELKIYAREYVNGENKIKNEKYYKYFKSIYEFLIHKFIKYSYSSENDNTIHTHNYLYILYTFLNNNNIDLNKVKIIDIDSDENLLQNFLNLYEIETSSIDKESNNSTKEIIESLLHKIPNKNLVDNKLKQEYFFYKLLKNSNLNFK
jgi:hypothetical protein